MVYLDKLDDGDYTVTVYGAKKCTGERRDGSQYTYLEINMSLDRGGEENELKYRLYYADNTMFKIWNFLLPLGFYPTERGLSTFLDSNFPPITTMAHKTHKEFNGRDYHEIELEPAFSFVPEYASPENNCAISLETAEDEDLGEIPF